SPDLVSYPGLDSMRSQLPLKSTSSTLNRVTSPIRTPAKDATAITVRRASEAALRMAFICSNVGPPRGLAAGGVNLRLANGLFGMRTRSTHQAKNDFNNEPS